MSANLGETVYVENRPGAMNMLANKAVSRANPDGYTILYGSIDMTMAPSLRKDAAGFSGTKDLTPIAMAASTAGVYLVNPQLPVHTLSELASYARANPDMVRNAINGFGGSLHLTSKLFELKTGVKLLHVPYRGTSEAMLAIISGEAQTGTFALASGASNRDRVRVLAQTGATRHPLLPDVPTAAEAGMPDVGVIYWFGFYAPPNTPKQIVDRLAKTIELTMKDSEIQKKLANIGAMVDYLPPDKFADRITEEEHKWGDLIPKMGFKPE
jgi:tripartite-type tricarboxylate transporter receptor subunit TctC